MERKRGKGRQMASVLLGCMRGCWILLYFEGDGNQEMTVFLRVEASNLTGKASKTTFFSDESVTK